MQILTRRNALRATGIATLAPLLGISRAGSAILAPAQDSDAQDAAISSVPATYNFQLHSYVQESFSSLSAKVRSNSAHVEDIAQAASAAHQYASHIELLNFDLVSPYLAKNMVTHTSDDVDRLHEAFRKHDPSRAREDVEASLSAADAHIAASQASLLKHGLSWHFYSAAQALRIAQKITAINHADSASCKCGKTARYTNAVYHFRESNDKRTQYEPVGYGWPSAHLERVDFSSVCKKLVCRGLNGYLGSELTEILINAFSGLTAAAFCDIDLVVSILGDVGTDGVLSIASPLEAALCALAKAAASPGAVLTSQILGGIIGGAIGDLQNSLGCPV